MLCNIKVSKLKNFKVNPLGLVYGSDYSDDYAGTRILADRVDFSVLGNDEERYYPNRILISKINQISNQIHKSSFNDKASWVVVSNKEVDDYIRKLFKRWRRP